MSIVTGLKLAQSTVQYWVLVNMLTEVFFLITYSRMTASHGLIWDAHCRGTGHLL